MSGTNQTRNRQARPAVQRGPRQAASAPPAQQVGIQFPPVLPVSIRKYIDGVNLVGIQLNYTQFGVTVFGVRPDNTTVPLEQYIRDRKVSKTQEEASALHARFSARIAERNITGLPAMPAPTATKGEIEAWLASITDATKRRILTMTNREFRAQQGADAATQVAA